MSNLKFPFNQPQEESIKLKSIRSFLKALEKDMSIIKKKYILLQKEHNGTGEWLFDNYHLIHKSYSDINKSFLYIKKLPFAQYELPRIYEYAFDYCRIYNNKIEKKSLETYIADIGKKIELQNNEINLFINVFKIALIKIAASQINEDEKDSSFYDIITSLRFLSNYSYSNIYEKISKNEALLNVDDCYRKMDKASKDLYRHKISEKALKLKKSEREIILEAIEKAKTRTVGQKSHFGFYFFENHKHYYLKLTIFIPIIAAISVAALSGNILCGILSVFPLWEISKSILDLIYSKNKPSEILPKIDFKQSCPKTLVTIITFIPDEKALNNVVSKLEEYYFANRCDGLLFGFLADLPAADKEIREEDLKLCEQTKQKIDELNKKYENSFFGTIRKRSFVKENNHYSGKERKRGAVEDFLNFVLSQNPENFMLTVGNFEGAKYFTALDGDTKPGIDSIKKLLGVLEHPLSHPVYNAAGTAVESGYGIAAPRIDVSLKSSGENLFTQLIGGIGGTEMYGNGSFSVYQDLYKEGIFAGKGVINIECFCKVLENIFPENKVLSHDILEGSFLRAAYVSDVSFSDTMPKSPISFVERNHRWVRGDWQNISYIKKTMINKNGEKLKNPISYVSKYKLFDNLRRSLIDTFCFLAIIYGALFCMWTFWIALISVFTGTIIDGLNMLFRLDMVKNLKYRTKVVSPFTRSVFSSVFSFMLLPYFAFKNFDAAIRAIYRLIKKRKLMEWTTAEQADKKIKGTMTEFWRKMYPQFFGIILLFNPWWLILSAFWIFAIPLSFLSTRSATKKRYKIKEEVISSEIRDMWSYFEDFLNEQNNYLPPDNYQEEPLGVEAKRSSPTNIGLAMLCCLGAFDMGFIDEKKLYFYIENMLASIDSLEKWKGHLLNWYNIENLKPLYPKYVSTVDNGNFICSVFTVRNGLKSFQTNQAEKIIKKLDFIINNTDFTLLFNKKKDLFHIGYDCEKEEHSDSYYDLYASEAQLTSYYGISTRQIPLSHWKKLGRYTSQKHGYMNIKSWTGTMFEYFMPKLLLPNYENSLSDEMLHAALAAQINRNKKAIWGNSESAFYSFDAALVYQYKAFGVQNLALKRGMNDENVISPYSSWIVMPLFPKEATENLNRIKKMGAYGKYGYYDAIDKTPIRTGGAPAIVKNYMVHHIGMSFISGLNLLKDNIMQKRFMNKEMSAFSDLLEEKLPTHIIKYDKINNFEEIKERYVPRYEEHSVLHPDYPVVRSLSNGIISSFVTDSGIGSLKRKNIMLTKHRDTSEEPKGVFSFFKYNGGFLSATNAPIYDETTSYKTLFEDGKFVFFAKQKEVESRLSICVHPKYNCEIRELIIKNNSQKKKSGKLLLYFEPVLCEKQKEEAHPAFSGLFLNAENGKDKNILYINRRKREHNEPSPWISVMPKLNGDMVEYEYELSRFKVLDHLKGIKGIESSFFKTFNNKNTPIDPCVAIRFPIEINPKESVKIIYYIGYGNTKQEAAEVITKSEKTEFSQISASCKEMILSLYRKNGLRKEDVKLYEILLSSAFIKSKIRFNCPQLQNTIGIERLWKYGVSNDYPIIMIKVDDKNVDKTISFLKAFIILKAQNFDCELAFCFSEGGRYDRPVYSTIRDYIRSFGLEKYFNARNGVFLCDIKNMEDFALFSSLCRFYADLEKGWKIQNNHKNYKNTLIYQSTGTSVSYSLKTGMGGFIRNEENSEYGFAISDKNVFSERPPWCHVLANSKFGTIVSDSSLGFTFAHNSSQNKLTPWSNDVITDNKGESLILSDGNEKYELMAGATAKFFKGRAEYETIIGSIKIKICVFVPIGISAKIIKIETSNVTASDIVIKYEIKPVLGVKEIAGSVNRENDNNVVYYNNPLNTEYAEGFMFMLGINTEISGNSLRAICRTGEKTESYFIIGYGENKKQAKQSAELLKSTDYIDKEFEKLNNMFKTENSIYIDTPDKTLNMLFNTFLSYQTVYSRLMAKTGFYQNSGAIGFRDQLQDSLCLSIIKPIYLKRQLICAAKHQFEEGDVMHWWHSARNENDPVKGVRSRSSDDLLWLPFALCEYLEKTEDYSILDIDLRYIKAPELNENENEKYLTAETSDKKESLYEHAKKALKRGIKTGERGLILFGSGDWNDGMTEVGSQGKGETVWGSFFSVWILEKIKKVAIKLGDIEFADYCDDNSKKLRKAIDEAAWDGKWYIRGFYDNKAPLGSHLSDECQIDLLPQSFSSIVGGFDPHRVRLSLDSAEKELVDRTNKIIKLFSKPFVNSKNNPGYIKGYVSGIRENGGQYTHAALWYVLGLFKDNQYDKAYEMLYMLNPVNKSKTKADTEKYRIEPYVLSGDVYSNPDVAGMGGWSHYTGAAGWYFKVVTEELLGINRKGNKLTLDPKLPESWKEYKANLLIDGAKISILVKKSRDRGMLVDREEKTEIMLDKKDHEVIYMYSPI